MGIDFYINYIINIFLCIILGFIIGYERKKSKHSAGIRTYTLIILGTYIFSIISDLINVNNPNIDPTRIISAIIQGIGFIGSGIIFKHEKKSIISGITTASLVWVAASIGGLIAINMRLLAIITVIFIEIFLYAIKKIPLYDEENKK